MDSINCNSIRFLLFDSNVNTKPKTKSMKIFKPIEFPSEEDHSEMKVFEENYFVVFIISIIDFFLSKILSKIFK